MIRNITIKGYRGIDESAFAVPPAGLVIAGPNGSGKTSHLRAVRAALAAQDIGPDAVRLGRDKAEIIIDLEDVTVRRAITRKGNTLTVTTTDGDRKTSPQTFLSALLGASPLDPLDFYLASKKERRAQVLAALPIAVDRAWLAARVPDLPAGFDCAGHGFDVLERARKLYYDRRTAANATAKGAKEAAERARVEAEAAARGGATLKVSVAEADAALSAARKRIAELEAQDAEAKKGAARTAGARARIDALRAEAKQAEDAATTRKASIEARAPAVETEYREAADECEAAEKAFKIAEARWDRASERVAAARANTAAHEKLVESARGLTLKASDLHGQADMLAQSLAEASVAPVDAAELDRARDDAGRAHELTLAAKRAEAAEVAHERASAAGRMATETQAVADKLDRVVEDLGAGAQAELVATSAGIPGLTIEGDEVLLEGVAVGALCGAEQMYLAIDLARRLNAKGRLIVCDGLERLDPAQLVAFVEHATAGGFQLLATRVRGGEVTFDAIGAPAAQAVQA